MKKFYRYLIYKLYSWGLKKKGDTPVANVIFTLGFVHFVQLFLFYALMAKIFPQAAIFYNINEIYVGVFLVVFLFINYFIFYNKYKWLQYLEEFKDESIQESRRGKILVLTYLIGSILLFFIMMPVLFGV